MFIYHEISNIPVCFQKPQFKLDDTIKIIEYQKKKKLQQIESKKDFKENAEPEGASSDEDIIEKINKTRKNKKPKENI